MIKKMTHDFIAQRVHPNIEAIDQQEPGLVERLMEEAGELGLLGSSVSEDLGGMGLDFKTTMLITEAIGDGHAFSVSFSAHTGIGTLPILYYGNDAQKQKYVPGMASRPAQGLLLPDRAQQRIGRQQRQDHRQADRGRPSTIVINGQKMWITNGGFADVMIVFAKIDDDKNLTAFIVDGRQRGHHQELPRRRRWASRVHRPARSSSTT